MAVSTLADISLAVLPLRRYCTSMSTKCTITFIGNHDGAATREEYEIDDDPARVDPEAAIAFLTTQAYWARWRNADFIREQIRTAWRVVGAYDTSGAMVGFARAFSDGHPSTSQTFTCCPGMAAPGWARRSCGPWSRTGRAPACGGCSTPRTRTGCTGGSASRPMAAPTSSVPGVTRPAPRPPSAKPPADPLDTGTLAGAHVRLEPLGYHHAPGLLAASSGGGDLYRWMGYLVPTTRSRRAVSSRSRCAPATSAPPCRTPSSAPWTGRSSGRHGSTSSTPGHGSSLRVRARSADPRRRRDRMDVAEQGCRPHRGEHRDEAAYADARLRLLARPAVACTPTRATSGHVPPSSASARGSRAFSAPIASRPTSSRATRALQHHRRGVAGGQAEPGEAGASLPLGRPHPRQYRGGMRYVEEIGFPDEVIGRGARAVEGLPAGLVYAGFSLGVLRPRSWRRRGRGRRGRCCCIPVSRCRSSALHGPGGVPVQVHGWMPTRFSSARATLTLPASSPRRQGCGAVSLPRRPALFRRQFAAVVRRGRYCTLDPAGARLSPRR